MARLAACENLLKRALEDSSMTEPVMVITEGLDSCPNREVSLSLPSFRDSQVVVSEVCWNSWLAMAREEWPRVGHVTPLGEPRPPPLVVLRHRVELWQVQGDKSYRELAIMQQGSHP